ncbi:MAG: HAD family hydrolase [Ruminococcaceae bacterium]|nr:HAD family hydrolase [Oscillospiraceae bacterium]
MKTLYISDLDGTLLHSDALPSEHTVETVNFLVEKGYNITFATARSISSAAEILPDFRLKLPVVMMNGVCLTDINSKKQLNVFSMSREVARKAIEIFERHGRPPMHFTIDEKGEICVDYKLIKSEYEREFMEVRRSRYNHFVQCREYDTSSGAVYLSAIDRKETVEAIVEELKLLDGIGFTYYLDTYSDGQYFIEVYSSLAGKQNAINLMKERYGFDRVVAFGDNGNDVEMLQNADIGIAVGNAQQSAKLVADLVIDTNENDGVAKYLMELYHKGELSF